jgi:hypothetical protein
MSRSLYLCLLSLVEEVERIVFVYAIGDYSGVPSQYPVSVLGDIRSVPGLEGYGFPARPKVYVIGLGYDGIGTKALVDRLEADRLVVFWTDPGADSSAAQTVCVANEMVIGQSMAQFRTDLRDVAGTVRILRRIALETRSSEKLVLVPVGPKPHVLASGILAAGCRHATLLAPYLGVDRGGADPPRILPNGQMVVTVVRTVAGASLEGTVPLEPISRLPQGNGRAV